MENKTKTQLNKKLKPQTLSLFRSYYKKGRGGGKVKEKKKKTN